MGAWLFRNRLSVMAGAFLAALCSAILSAQVARSEALLLKPIWAWGQATEFPPPAFMVLTGVGCLVAFGIRVWGESLLGAAVYGQGETAGLLDRGPYARVRNPLYLGTWLFFVSCVMLWAPALLWLLLSTLFAAALHAMVLHEETLLSSSLGEPYRAYLRRVPRWLPGLRGGAPTPGGPARVGAAVLGNIGLLGLGLFRVVVGAGMPGEVPALVNLVLLCTWLGVVLSRRLRR